MILIVSYLTFKFTASVCMKNGAVAQLGERVNGIHEVVGSIPSSSTDRLLHLICIVICDILVFKILSFMALNSAVINNRLIVQWDTDVIKIK